MKQVWPQLVEEEKQAIVQKLCHDIYRFCREKAKHFVVTNPDYVTTKSGDKLFHNNVLVCCVKAKRQTLLRQSFIILRQSFIMSRQSFIMLRQSQ